ncbi:TetR/AcrR family transcriptional regulator [Paraglaciecola sp. 20A4]|uniref:TetR/AcrR family transcriptional regulator n=1 Tax=Paraglaciecola sp. 20A4 TaxID=2687288 RepID=UPI00197DA046|nr:TetR/AcrR family transcriptional regulator [Paraglaciecola sp. 20A4]
MIQSNTDTKPDGTTLRKLKARQKMIIAADELFEELGGFDGGYEATTIDLIVERAGVSRRTFFNHFTGKADVILLDFRTSLEDHLNAFNKRPEDEPPVLSALMAAEDIYEHFLDNPVNIRRFIRQNTYGFTKASQLSLTDEWSRKLAAAMMKKLKGKNRPERAAVMAAHTLLIIRMANIDWFNNGLKKGQPIIKSIRKAELLANKVAEEIYPIIID